MNHCMDLNWGWEFARGNPGRGWREGAPFPKAVPVDLPHCWNEKEEFQEKVQYYRGMGCYRLRFTPDPALVGSGDAGPWMLESEGFYGTGDLWLNGVRVGEIDGEYLGFRLDISGFIRPDQENVLAVHLTNRCDSHVLPGIDMPDFLLYGGLSGKVRLVREPELRLERGSLRVCCGPVADEAAVVRASCDVMNGSTAVRRLRLRWRIAAASGAEAAVGESAGFEAAPGARCEAIAAELRVGRPRAWSPDDPFLYIATCELVDGDAVLDSASCRIGFRTAAFVEGGGFHLNGQRLELRGCNRHESMPGFGRALPDCVHAEDARLIKETGFNIVRLSHYPQSPAFLDACDELGIMVYAEIATWKSVTTGKWLRSAKRQMERMILRDRNHPCVILWGMGNESRSLAAYRELGDVIRRLDPDRPSIYAENHIKRARREGTIGIPDVWGCNYEIEVLEEARRAAKLGVTLVSEYGNMPTARRGDAAEELRQCSAIAAEWRRMDGIDFNAGHIVWSFNDYSTLRKDRYMRYSGVFDAWRVPKAARWMMQAAYLREPFVRMLVDWGTENPNRVRQLRVFTNCDHIEILVNGRKIIEGEVRRQVAWSVIFEPGELEVRAAANGGSRAVHRMRSYGPGARVALEPDRVELPAAARDTVVLTVRVVDGNGDECVSWNGAVRMSLAGPARLRTHTPDDIVPVAGGRGRVYVTGSGLTGQALIGASCAGLEPASCCLAFL